MKLELPFKEVQKFLSNTHHINIGLKNIEEDKIKINYCISLVLTIKEVKADEVIFRYEANALENIFLKSARFLLKKKLKNIPLEWGFRTKEITIDLKKVKELSEFLKVSFISELCFVNDTILLEVNLKSEN